MASRDWAEQDRVTGDPSYAAAAKVGYGGATQAPRDMDARVAPPMPRDFDQLSEMAEHAERLSDKLAEMLNRWGGEILMGNTDSVPDYGHGHIGQMRRLGFALKTIDERVETLGNIA